MTATATALVTTATRTPHQDVERIYINILEDVYIDPQLNHRALEESKEDISSLMAQIETTGGLLQAIGIVLTPDGREHDRPYELMYGFRRCTALKQLAEESGCDDWVTSVPADLRAQASPQDRYLMQLIENLGRKDLKEIEIALAFQQALDDPATDLNQKQLAKLIGWPESTVSNYLKVVRALPSAILDQVIAGQMTWSNARLLAGSKLEGDTLTQMAALATTLDHDTLKGKIDSITGKPEAAADEAAPTGEAATAEATGEAAPSQKASLAKRSNEVRDKYIPHFKEELEKAKEEQARLIWTARLDAAKFLIGEDGTQLGTDLAPWEEELAEKALEQKAEAEQARIKHAFIRKAIKAMNDRLLNVPPIDAKDRRLPTLPEVFAQVKDEIKHSIDKAKEANVWTDGEVPMVLEGFPVGNLDAFMEELNTAYAQDEKKKAENKKKREEALAKKKQEEEAAKLAALNADKEALAAEGQAGNAGEAGTAETKEVVAAATT